MTPSSGSATSGNSRVSSNIYKKWAGSPQPNSAGNSTSTALSFADGTFKVASKHASARTVASGSTGRRTSLYPSPITDVNRKCPVPLRKVQYENHSFLADVETCVRCGGPMRWVEVATTPQAIARLLAKHGLGPGPPKGSAPARAPGQLALPFKSSTLQE